MNGVADRTGTRDHLASHAGIGNLPRSPQHVHLRPVPRQQHDVGVRIIIQMRGSDHMPVVRVQARLYHHGGSVYSESETTPIYPHLARRTFGRLSDSPKKTQDEFVGAIAIEVCDAKPVTKRDS